MKIISYNISRFSQEKLDHILSDKADIYILPELACPQMVSLVDEPSTVIGQDDAAKVYNRHKE